MCFLNILGNVNSTYVWVMPKSQLPLGKEGLYRSADTEKTQLLAAVSDKVQTFCLRMLADASHRRTD